MHEGEKVPTMQEMARTIQKLEARIAALEQKPRENNEDGLRIETRKLATNLEAFDMMSFGAPAVQDEFHALTKRLVGALRQFGRQDIDEELDTIGLEPTLPSSAKRLQAELLTLATAALHGKDSNRKS